MDLSTLIAVTSLLVSGLGTLFTILVWAETRGLNERLRRWLEQLPPAFRILRHPIAGLSGIASAILQSRFFREILASLIAGIILLLLVALVSLFSSTRPVCRLFDRCPSSSEMPIATPVPFRIVSPQEGDAVAPVIAVEIDADQPPQGWALALLARPLPERSDQSYWVQQPPKPVGGRRWHSWPVHIGRPDDLPGTPFDICAVLTTRQLEPGEQLGALPESPSDCVGVTSESPELSVLYPVMNSSVPPLFAVEVQTRPIGSGQSLFVLVGLNPDDPAQDYEVQEPLKPTGVNLWKLESVHVGGAPIPPSTSFVVCAVITSQQLHVSDRLHALPPGAFDCVSATTQTE